MTLTALSTGKGMLNPVVALLNSGVMEYSPKHGKRFAEEVERWGRWVREEVSLSLASFHPDDPHGSIPIG
jgi:adenine-specific DNA methylase